MTLHKKSNAIISLINQTNKTITNQNIIKSRQFILITISGGQDSLCLFFILLQLKKQWKWHLGISYCNHFWQIDSFYTNSLVFKLGLLFLIPAYLNLPSENIFSEQKSRTWRYRQFERLNYFYDYDIIVTGHTATDRIETILLHLTRGTSTRGLSTLNWVRDLPRSNKKAKRSFTWQVKSMEKPVSPTVQQLNFLERRKVINLALSSSEKSRSLSAEHKSTTNKVLSVQNTNFLHKVYAKYSSKKTLFPRFVLGTNQVSLPLGESKLGFPAPEETATSFKKNNSLLYNESFLIEFCSQFFLQYQLSFSKSSFFLKKKNLTSYCHKTVKSSFPKLLAPSGLVARLASFACTPNPERVRLTTKACLPTTRKALYKRLYFMHSIKSYPEKARLIKITYLPTESSYLTRESDYLSKWYLRLQSNLFARSLNKASLQVNSIALQHNWKCRYYYNYNFQDNKKCKKAKTYLGVLSTSFIRCVPVVINYSLIFRKNFASHQANIFKEKMKSFSSLHYNHRAKLTAKSKLKCYAISNKYKYLSFSFNTVILNKKPSKILIKWLKKLYWIKLKNKFIEFEVCKFKQLSPKRQGQQLDFLGRQPLVVNLTLPGLGKQADPPRCVKLTPSGLDFIWETKLDVSSKVSLYGEKCGLSLVQTFGKPFIPCRGWQGNGQSEFVYHPNFRISQCLFKPYLILSKYQQAAITRTLKKQNWGYIEDFNRILSTYISRANVNYKLSLSTIDNNNLTKKRNENIQFAIPSQKGFGWSKTNKKKCFIIRPLLFITRFDLKKVCVLWELPIYPDQTNEKLIYFRNRIRKQLLPLLRFFFNPQIDKLFLQFTEIVNTEQLYLDTLSISLLEEFQINKRNTFELNLSTFNFIPLAIQRRLLKQFIDQYLVKKIKFFHIQILLKLLIKKKTKKPKSYDKLRFNNTLINKPNLRIQSFTSQLKTNCNEKSCFQEEISEFILWEPFLLKKEKERKTFFLKDISRTHNQSKFFLKYYYEKTIQNKSNIYFIKPSKLSNFSANSQYNLELNTTYEIKSKRLFQLYQSYDDQSSSFKKKLEENKFSLDKKKLYKSQTDYLMDQSLINAERLKFFSIAKQNKDIRFKLRKNLGDLDKIVKSHNLFASKNKLEIPQISLLFGVGAYFIASRRFIVLSIF